MELFRKKFMKFSFRHDPILLLQMMLPLFGFLIGKKKLQTVLLEIQNQYTVSEKILC